MKVYPLNFNTQTYEIFPEEIWSNKLVVFHGTTTFHSQCIEKNGFKKNYIPYNLDYAKKLIELFNKPEISQFDDEKYTVVFDFDKTKSNTANAINQYLATKKSPNSKISFFPLSTSCLKYTIGDNKGGLAFNFIRKTKHIIAKAVLANPYLQKEIPIEVIQLFDLLAKLDNSQSVVYAIKLHYDLNNIQAEDVNKTIYSLESIPASSIVGKIIIPNDSADLSLDMILLENKLSKKYFNGIGQILNREK
jgi:hypothetical protein